jgi:hypothetical protein
MKERTKQEIQNCQEFLKQPDISDHDREMAERGLNDWFWQSLIDDGLLNDDRRNPPVTT